MRFLNLIMGLVLAHGCLWSADQAQAVSLDFVEQSAKATASRIQANPRAIFSDPRVRQTIDFSTPISSPTSLASVKIYEHATIDTTLSKHRLKDFDG